MSIYDGFPDASVELISSVPFGIIMREMEGRRWRMDVVIAGHRKAYPSIQPITPDALRDAGDGLKRQAELLNDVSASGIIEELISAATSCATNG